MPMGPLGSPRTASIVVALLVLALVPIVVVAWLGVDGGADEPTAAVSGRDDTADELAALERRVLVLENRDDRRTDELTALREDLDAVRTALTDLDEADLPAALEATDEQMATLVDTLTVLDEELAVLGDAVAGQRTELEATANELRGGIGELRGGLGELRSDLDRTGGNVEVLRGEVATLRDRLDRIQRGG